MQEHCVNQTTIVRCKLRKEPLNPATRPHADDTWLTGVFYPGQPIKKIQRHFSVPPMSKSNARTISARSAYSLPASAESKFIEEILVGQATLP
jgi:hypothetical protein